MNAPLSAFRLDDEQLLDRLVDGELAEPERRQLLLQLESDPDGWRRCALAFLEAQAWGREFRHAAKEAVSDGVPRSAEKIAVLRSPFFGSRFGGGLALAASFLLAFGLGLVWRGWDANRSTPAGIGSLASNAGRAAVVADSPYAPRPSVASTFPEQPVWEVVYLPVDEDQDGVAEPIELPLAYGPGIDEKWLAQQPAGVPVEFLQALERRGHKIQQNRQFMPVTLDDGRQAVVPVDQFEVQFAQHRSYQ